MTDEPQIGQTADSGFPTVALADWKVIAVTANSTPVLWPRINSLVWPVGTKLVMAIIKFVNKDEAFAHNGTCARYSAHIGYAFPVTFVNEWNTDIWGNGGRIEP